MASNIRLWSLRPPQLVSPSTLEQNTHSCHDGKMKQDMDVLTTSASPPSSETTVFVRGRSFFVYR